MTAEAPAPSPTVTATLVPILRKWALNIVGHLLDEKPLGRLPLSDEEMLFLAEATPLNHQPKRTLLERAGFTTRMLPRNRRARQRLRNNPEAWKRRIYNRAAQQLQKHEDRFVADFWRPVAEAAWGDPCFASQFNLYMQTYWRQRSLFPKGVMPLCHTEPSTFWLLLFMHAHLSQEATAALLRRLQVIVHQESLIPGWAHFWDQWLLWKMLDANPAIRKKLNGRTRRSIESLPFFKIASPEVLETKRPSLFRRVLRPIKHILLIILPGFAPSPTHNLAHRSWERDMPSFLYNHHLPRKRRKE